MSAILGTYHTDGSPVSQSNLEAMLCSLAHRGADHSALWLSENIGIGHRLFQTTPESLREKSPLVLRGGALAITADSRIDNRNELLHELNIEKRLAADISDSEIILRAYEKWGDGCPEKLLGDFSFAIWDKDRRRLFCARDYFGVKQFYYHAAHHLFAFATEIKALFALPCVPRRLNEARIADYLLSQFADKRATLYEGIYRLPPGHSLTVSQKGLQLKQYWALNPESELRLKSAEEYAEAYLALFKKAVKCRMRSNAVVGTTLSGGLDSSSIACVARDINQENGRPSVPTFSTIYEEVPSCDERFYMNSVVAQGGVNPVWARADKYSPLVDWEARVEGEDEPLWNPQMAIHWGLYEAANEAGVRVLLDGMGGDAVVSHGTSYLNELAFNWRWVEWLTQARTYSRRTGYPLKRIFLRRGLLPLMPESIWGAWRGARSRQTHAWLKGVPLRPDFVSRINLRERMAFLYSDAYSLNRNSRQHHLLEVSSGLWSFSLGVADRTTALFGIERRQPFFDRRLVEFCLALPPEQKLLKGWTRIVARRAMQGILPKEIQWRAGKTNHSPNFHQKLLTADRHRWEEFVSDPPQQMAEYIDIAALRKLYYRYLSFQETQAGSILWRLSKLAFWLERRDKSRREFEKPKVAGSIVSPESLKTNNRYQTVA